MEKALRRQLGAVRVDIDTRKSSVSYATGAPHRLDWETIRRAADGAGYTLKQVEVSVLGVRQGGVFAVAGTGQKLPLIGDLPAKTAGFSPGEWPEDGATMRLRGELKRASGGALTLSPLTVSAPSAPRPALPTPISKSPAGP